MDIVFNTIIIYQYKILNVLLIKMNTVKMFKKSKSLKFTMLKELEK